MDNNGNKNNIDEGENTEENSLDNILNEDGDGSENENENIAEILKKSETLKSSDSNNTDSDNENDENQDDREKTESIDSEEAITSAEAAEDEVVSQFADEGVEESPEEAEKKKNQKKVKFIKRVSIISAICAVVIAAGIFAFIQINKYIGSYVISFDGRNISVDDFNFFLIYNGGATDPKSSAQDMLEQYLVLEKAAKERNLTLTADEANEANTTAASLKSQIDSNYPQAGGISLNFLEEIVGTGYYVNKLVDAVAAEKGYTFDDADFQTALTDYIANGKQQYLQMNFKYIVAGSTDTAAEAKKAIEDKTMAVDDAIKKYSTYYDATSGIQTIPIADITFLSAADLNNLMNLEAGQVSDVIKLSDTEYVVFIADSVYRPTQDEISASYKTTYENGKKSDIFQAEFTKWQADAKIKVNQKVLDGINLDALLKTPADTSNTGTANSGDTGTTAAGTDTTT